jgi:putative ABC transport system permease protein
VIFLGAADYQRYWATSSPSAFGVQLVPGVDATRVRAEIVRALGPASGLEVSTAPVRVSEIDALADAGLSRLGEISTLLTIAAILALATALASTIWQRRVTLAELRLTGVTPARLRRILLLESTLLLGAGCLTGAIVGLYGQVVIDGYLRNVTGFPIVTLTAGLRPLELLVLVIAIVLVLVAIPGWLAARVSPTLALEE